MKDNYDGASQQGEGARAIHGGLFAHLRSFQVLESFKGPLNGLNIRNTRLYVDIVVCCWSLC